jgi:hypothetical protein
VIRTCNSNIQETEAEAEAKAGLHSKTLLKKKSGGGRERGREGWKEGEKEEGEEEKKKRARLITDLQYLPTLPPPWLA